MKKREKENAILKIKSDRGELLTLPKDINKRFAQFYQNLYTSKTSIDNNKVSEFLENCILPQLELREQEELGAKITSKEIEDTIKTLKNGKTPGPGGFSNEFYKAFYDIVTPRLQKMYTYAFKEQSLPETLAESTITLILKKDKNIEPGSYRAIALLNTDQKIITKTLASRLSRYVSRLINGDQTGFIPKIHSFNNLRRLISIMHSHKSHDQELSIISLDAEKAFDQVEWDYMIKVLQKFQLGENFIAWIKLLYNKPTARILTNNILSSKFELSRGNRQGCSLSPLLFALVIDTC